MSDHSTRKRRSEITSATLESLLESSNSPVFSVDTGYCYVSFNASHAGVMKALYGADIEVGKSILDYQTVEADRHLAQANLDRALRGERLVEDAFSGEEARTRRCFKVTHDPIRCDGDIVGVVVQALDVTELARADAERLAVEQELREARDYLENLFGYANAPVIVWDPELRITRFNHAFEELTRRSADEVVGRHLELLFPEDERRTQALAHVTEASAGERWQVVEIPILRADGEVRTVLWNSATVYAADGVTPVATIAQGQDITERKRAEAELRESEERFRIAAETANDVVYEWDLKQEVRWLGNIDDMLGYDPGEFPRTLDGWAASVHPDDLERTMAQIQAHLESRAPYAAEYRVRRKDGVYRWWTARGAAARTPDGKPLRLIGSVTDITERKHAGAELREARDYLENLFGYANAPVIVWDPELRITRFNHAFEELTGRSADEAIGCHLEVLFPDDERRTQALHHVTSASAGERWQVVEIPILRADGEVRTVLWNSATVYAADGVTPVATIAQGQDITERVIAERALRESESRFRQLVDSLPQLVWTCQADGQCDSLSRRWVAYTGVPEAQQLGFRWLEQVHPDDRAPTVAAWEAAVAAGTDFHVEFRIRRHDGEYRWFDTQAVRLRDADGNTVKWVGSNTDLTERRHAEAALAESEDKFRYMFDHSAVPRSTTQPSGEIEVNQAFLEMVGYTREEIGEGATWQQISHPDDAAQTDGIVASMVSGESTSARFEKRYLHKDGSVIWADVSTALRRDADGNADYFMTTIVDITERRRAEEALRESEEKYRGLFANAQVGMFRTRLDGSAVLTVNPKMCEIIGYTEEEILADPATIRWADPEARTVMIQELQAAGSLKDYEFDIVHSSGEVRTVLGSMELRLEQGYLEGSATDITERKRAEEALLGFARRQATLFESLQDGLGVVDAAGVLLDANPALCAMTGFSREELIGAGPPHPFWPPEESAAIGEAFAPAMRGETNESELTFMRKSGERFAVVVSPSSVKDSEGRIELMFATMKDITERKRAEEQIRTLNRELEARVEQRTAELRAANNELEAFAYSVSHDLRAPLRHISGFSSLLAEQVGDSLDEKSRHYVDTISRSVHEMGVLIDDLLQFSRTGRAELQIKTVDMDQALAEALLPLQHETEGRAIEWSIGRLPSVVGDHALLRQVWANLLGNAVKFSRGRSPARIEVGAHDGDAADEDVFYVRDNGVGFDMQYVHKLFGVFQRLHSTAEFEGTGIGLANVQRIINRLGGRVWAEGKTDKGATFTFSLPRRKDTPS